MMEGEIKSSESANICKCPHHKVIPLLIFVVGLLFFLNALNVVTTSALTMLWPVALMLVGLMKMMGLSCTCCRH